MGRWNLVEKLWVDRIGWAFNLTLQLLQGSVDGGLAPSEEDAELLNMDGKSRGQKEDAAYKASLPVFVISSFHELANFPESIRKRTDTFALFGLAEFITKYGVKAGILNAIGVGEEGNIARLVGQSVARGQTGATHSATRFWTIEIVVVCNSRERLLKNW
jgi:hypothetical protein